MTVSAHSDEGTHRLRLTASKHGDGLIQFHLTAYARPGQTLAGAVAELIGKISASTYKEGDIHRLSASAADLWYKEQHDGDRSRPIDP